MKNYDLWLPSDYAQNSSLQSRWALQLLTTIPLEGAEKILDIGSGDGKITCEISRRAPMSRVIGIDLSPSMIHYAARKFSPAFYPNLNFMLADVRCLHFRREFDWVLSFACLHWVCDQIAVLKGIRRSLKQRGRVLLSLISGLDACLEEALHEISESNAWKERLQGFHDTRQFFSKEQYAQFLQEAQLETKQIDDICESEVFQDCQSLKGWLRNWLPQRNHLSFEDYQQFIDDVVSLCAQKKQSEEGTPIALDIARLKIEAYKSDL